MAKPKEFPEEQPSMYAYTPEEAIALAKSLRGRKEKDENKVFRFILLQRESGLSIKKWCKLLTFPNSTFYKWNIGKTGNPFKDWTALINLLQSHPLTKKTGKKTLNKRKEQPNKPPAKRRFIAAKILEYPLDIELFIKNGEISSEKELIIVTQKLIFKPTDPLYPQLLTELVRRANSKRK